jgi:hypothetical protein
MPLKVASTAETAAEAAMTYCCAGWLANAKKRILKEFNLELPQARYTWSAGLDAPPTSLLE